MSEPVADPISRSEFELFVKNYEVRHAELRLEVKEEVTDLKGQMNTLNAKLDEVSTQLARQSANGWKLLAVSLLNFILGGGLVGFLSYLHVFGNGH